MKTTIGGSIGVGLSSLAAFLAQAQFDGTVEKVSVVFILVTAVGVIWKTLQATTKGHLDELKEQEADLKQRLEQKEMILEDKRATVTELHKVIAEQTATIANLNHQLDRHNP